jgi:hypothetical protein
MAAKRKKAKSQLPGISRRNKENPGAKGRASPSGHLNMRGWLYTHVERETSKVEKRIRVELAKTPALELLIPHLGSLLYNAAQRLIDREAKTGETRRRDVALGLSCSRLFNECYAGCRLARTGQVLQAIVLLRSAYEVASQAIMLMENAELAEKWLAGRRIEPREIREKSAFAATHKDLYVRLTRLSHLNIESAVYYDVEVGGQQRSALGYGGWFAPKSAGQIVVQFLFTQLVFLEAFYATFAEDFNEHGLLWREETMEAIAELGAGESPISWDQYLTVWRGTLTDLVGHYNALPDDGTSISVQLNNLGPMSHPVAG